jgi:ectoine hydroxylase-related dioxygenase (phytanoyl-CoA dioxygenase family)
MLSTSSRERFECEGYTGPMTLVDDPTHLKRLRQGCWSELGVDPEKPGPTKANLSAWHHRQRWAYDLATHPVLLDAIEEILGPDIVLWAMHCWYKEPFSGKRVPWHQDATYWAIEPKKTVSAWIAIGPTMPENGCLRILPGSHRQTYAHAAIDDPISWFKRGVDAAMLDESTAVDLALAPGQAVLYNEATLQGSNPNRSAIPRLGISCRYTSPEVRFLMDKWTNAERIRTYVVRGTDNLHLNDAIRGVIPTE